MNSNDRIFHLITCQAQIHSRIGYFPDPRIFFVRRICEIQPIIFSTKWKRIF